jgi:rhodanese-related sulfurtransferase
MVALAAGLAAELALIQPQDLAARLGAKGPRPAIFHVGPNLLYRGKHIPGSVYAGPASRPEGLEALKIAAGKLSRDREVVLYCGCCPWDNCPNVKPAVALLKQMGFTHVQAMFVANNFAKDWIDRGYPVEEGAPSGSAFCHRLLDPRCGIFH